MAIERARFLVPGAGQRLVEQQNARLRGQRDGDFELALLAMGQRAGLASGARVQTRRCAAPPSPARSAPSSRAAAPEEPEAAIRACLHGQRDVLQRRESRQDRGDLERAREAAAARGSAMLARVMSSPREAMRPLSLARLPES